MNDSLHPASLTEAYPLSSNFTSPAPLPDWAVRYNAESRLYNDKIEQQVLPETAVAPSPTKPDAGAKAKPVSMKGRMSYGSDTNHQSSAPPSSSSSSSSSYDFRFASSEDLPDILQLITSSSLSSSSLSSSKSASVPMSKITTISDDLNGKTPHRWLLLETKDDEDLVSVCRISLDDKICTLTDLIVSEEHRRGGAASFMINKVESISYSSGCAEVYTSVGHWLDFVLDWLGRVGYVQYGGEVWPSERADEIPAFVKGGMVIYLRKILTGDDGKRSSAVEDVVTVTEEVVEEEDGLESLLNSFKDLTDNDPRMELVNGVTEMFDSLPPPPSSQGGNVSGSGGGGGGVGGVEGFLGGNELENLVGGLLKALKTDEGRETFKILSEKDQQS